MKKLIAGDIILPLWFPPSDIMDPELVAHLTSLKIPLLKGKPNLLLHDLGRFSSDFLLEKRLSNIFMPNNHTLVSSSEIFCFFLNKKNPIDSSSTHQGLVKRGFSLKVSVRTGVFTLPLLSTRVFSGRVMFRIVFKPTFLTPLDSDQYFLQQALLDTMVPSRRIVRLPVETSGKYSLPA